MTLLVLLLMFGLMLVGAFAFGYWTGYEVRSDEIALRQASTAIESMLRPEKEQ